MGVGRQFLVKDTETGEMVWSDRKGAPLKTRDADKPWISDALGFTADCLPEMEADRLRHGFTAVEFVPDPEVPGFMQTKIDGKRARVDYASHRGMIDKSSSLGGSAAVLPEDVRAAEARAKAAGSRRVRISLE